MQRDAQFPANARAGALDFFDEKSKRTWPNDHPATVSVDGAGQHCRFHLLQTPITTLCGGNPLEASLPQAGALEPHRR